jgi:hypothetical protein
MPSAPLVRFFSLAETETRRSVRTFENVLEGCRNTIWWEIYFVTLSTKNPSSISSEIHSRYHLSALLKECFPYLFILHFYFLIDLCLYYASQHIQDCIAHLFTSTTAATFSFVLGTGTRYAPGRLFLLHSTRSGATLRPPLPGTRNRLSALVQVPGLVSKTAENTKRRNEHWQSRSRMNVRL